MLHASSHRRGALTVRPVHAHIDADAFRTA